MNPVSGLVLYVIFWCVVLFAVLPWGVRPLEPSDPGYGTGAPANPRLVKKMIATTLITAAIWLIIYLIVQTEILSFRDWANGGSLWKRW
jgi:predicted secreted protein